MQKYLVAKYFSKLKVLYRFCATFSNKSVYITEAANDAYLGPEKETTFMGVLVDMSGFMVIFNYIIPISLYVTLGIYNTQLINNYL